MSSLKIKVANYFAKNSCPAWQSSRPVRVICRKIYRLIMETGARDYPYNNPEFAPWPECDEPGKYNLISDSCNFVIRRSTSYVAWRIKEATGEWLRIPAPGERLPGEHSFDAKHWDELLKYNGWRECAPWETPSRPFIVGDALAPTYFVGIDKKAGEFGQLYWVEDETTVTREITERGSSIRENCVLSYYEGFERKYCSIPSLKRPGIIWYRRTIRY